MKPAKTPPIDVCLIMEGTYPYVLGGVSSWVHQLVSGLPEVRFGLVTLLADGAPREALYPVPANVVYRQDVSLFEPGQRPLEPDRAMVEAFEGFHAAPSGSRCPFLGTIERLLRGRSARGLLQSRVAWRMIQAMYRQRQRSVALADYFWTWRAIHGPIFRLLEAALPPAPVYHTASTGYAGFLAALAKARYGTGMAITEHGLYTIEREIELFQAEWIYRPPSGQAPSPAHERFFKGWWRAKFRTMGELAYAQADRVVALHQANARLQVAGGAPADRLDIVPNGLDPTAFRPLRAARDWSERPFRIGLIGRVTPIKDVETFLRAAMLAGQDVPLEAYVIGPLDEVPAYAESCQELARRLGISGRVTFTGRADVRQWLPRLDAVVLTSVSESQPLVILEAHAAGLPVVASNVGACRELVEGRPGEDAGLGPSGFVTPPVSPHETAEAILKLARNPALHARMGAAGMERVERFYRQEAVIDYYRRLYGLLGRAG